MTLIALEIDQGDDEVIDITVVEPDLVTPVDLDGCKLWFYVRPTPSEAAILTKTSEVGEGITITDVAGGIAEVEIANADTASLAAALTGRKLRWELQIKDAALKITTLARGTIIINRDVIPVIV